MPMRCRAGFAVCLAALVCAAAPTTVAPSDMPAMADLAPREYPGIHNAVAYREAFISGGVPEGDAGFDTLAAMGVTTIISVDGAVPDVERARARGMRYIHLPIGYDGIDEMRTLELIRATRDAMHDGPVYIHCHHGMHRSAGAAAVVAVGLGWMMPEQATERMGISGTSQRYTGLYGCAAAATVISPEVIDQVPPDFPEISWPEDFISGMVGTETAMEHLRAIEEAGWRSPEDHPDLVPAAEAGRLANLLRVLADGDRAREADAQFIGMLLDGSELATTLEQLLAETPADHAALTEQLSRIGSSCTECHARYRD